MEMEGMRLESSYSSLRRFTKSISVSIIRAVAVSRCLDYKMRQSVSTDFFWICTNPANIRCHISLKNQREESKNTRATNH